MSKEFVYLFANLKLPDQILVAFDSDVTVIVHKQACPPVGIPVTVKLFEAVVDFGVPPVKKLVVDVSSLAVISILTPAVGKVEELIVTVTGKPVPSAAGA